MKRPVFAVLLFLSMGISSTIHAEELEAHEVEQLLTQAAEQVLLEQESASSEDSVVNVVVAEPAPVTKAEVVEMNSKVLLDDESAAKAKVDLSKVKVSAKKVSLTGSRMKSIEGTYDLNSFSVWLDHSLKVNGVSADLSNYKKGADGFEARALKLEFSINLLKTMKLKIIAKEGDDLLVAFDKRYEEKGYLYRFSLRNDDKYCLSGLPESLILSGDESDSKVKAEGVNAYYGYKFEFLGHQFMHRTPCLKISESVGSETKKVNSTYQGY